MYINTKISQLLQESLSNADGLIHYWNHAGLKNYPFLARVALSQLSTPAGSAVLENDFSTFANLVTRHRSNLDPAIIDMIIFCKLNVCSIPKFIPRISGANIAENITIKLRDPLIQQALRLMNQEEIDDDDDSDPYVDDYILILLVTIFRFRIMIKFSCFHLCSDYDNDNVNDSQAFLRNVRADITKPPTKLIKKTLDLNFWFFFIRSSEIA